MFDTLRVELGTGMPPVVKRAEERRINLRRFPGGRLGVSLDETTTLADVRDLLEVFSGKPLTLDLEALAAEVDLSYPARLARQSAFLEHPTFSSYHAEHELLRYLHRLEARDLSLTSSMIPLGSCTMKLNATSEMLPVTWPEFGALHPFVPLEQAQGYVELFTQLEAWLAEITGRARSSSRAWMMPARWAAPSSSMVMLLSGTARLRTKKSRTPSTSCTQPRSFGTAW